ncbi:hypothetical protein KIPB_015195 [Kipferlia bialata]|uniref:Uncharacterized protein n=1 Tax=Kipferlia bialata TaxID=797122 RepID=A0A391NU15_9EUKA|nr:hypothetical protein KIPB_015195 [Kipferlia bialata]|eukprot:g15195.t1
MHIFIEDHGNYALGCEAVSVKVTRSGNSISIPSWFTTKPPLTFPCTPGEETRVHLTVDTCYAKRKPTLTISQ